MTGWMERAKEGEGCVQESVRLSLRAEFVADPGSGAASGGWADGEMLHLHLLLHSG